MSKGRKYTIYVVDDEQFNLLIISKKLKRSFNCKTKLFTNLSDCKKAIKKDHPDLILCDYRLNTSDENGGLMLSYIDSLGLNIPVIIYSYLMDVDLKMDLIGKGASDFVPRNKTFLKTLTRSVRHQLIAIRNRVKERRLGLAYLVTIICISFVLFHNELTGLFSLSILEIILIWGCILVLFFAYAVTDRRQIVNSDDSFEQFKKHYKSK